MIRTSESKHIFWILIKVSWVLKIRTKTTDKYETHNRWLRFHWTPIIEWKLRQIHFYIKFCLQTTQFEKYKIEWQQFWLFAIWKFVDDSFEFCIVFMPLLIVSRHCTSSDHNKQIKCKTEKIWNEWFSINRSSNTLWRSGIYVWSIEHCVALSQIKTNKSKSHIWRKRFVYGLDENEQAKPIKILAKWH